MRRLVKWLRARAHACSPWRLPYMRSLIARRRSASRRCVGEIGNLKESLPQEGTFAPSHEIAIVMANKRPHKNHAHKKPFVGRIIQVNGKWETDNSHNLTTFAGFWTENSEKPGDLSKKPWSDNRGK